MIQPVSRPQAQEDLKAKAKADISWPAQAKATA